MSEPNKDVPVTPATPTTDKGFQSGDQVGYPAADKADEDAGFQSGDQVGYPAGDKPDPK